MDCSIFSFLLSSIHTANCVYIYIYFHTLLMRNVCVLASYILNIKMHPWAMAMNV